MSEYYKGLTVTLDHDIHEDDAKAIIAAIRMVKGVLDVSPVTADFNDYIVRTRTKAEIAQAIWNVFDVLNNRIDKR